MIGHFCNPFGKLSSINVLWWHGVSCHNISSINVLWWHGVSCHNDNIMQCVYVWCGLVARKNKMSGNQAFFGVKSTRDCWRQHFKCKMYSCLRHEFYIVQVQDLYGIGDTFEADIGIENRRYFWRVSLISLCIKPSEGRRLFEMITKLKRYKTGLPFSASWNSVFQLPVKA